MSHVGAAMAGPGFLHSPFMSPGVVSIARCVSEHGWNASMETRGQGAYRHLGVTCCNGWKHNSMKVVEGAVHA